MFNLDPTTLLLNAIAFIIAGTFHEAAHAYTAYWLGDRTPQREGRLSLNPMRHMDWLGLILVMIVGIGWARTVTTNPAQFRINRKWGMLLVALAGPISNLLLAIVLIVIYRFTVTETLAIPAYQIVLFSIIKLNVLLATFNLLPVYPLDGEKVLRGLLPLRYMGMFHQMEKYGQFILLLIMFIPPLSNIFIITPYVFVLHLLFGVII